MPRSFLVVISHREPLGWVLTEQRMAFPAHRRREVTAAEPGDRLLLYATRGAFGSPTRDRGRVLADARLASSIVPLKEPVRFGDREFGLGCSIELRILAPVREGIDLAPLVPAMSSFPNKKGWAMYLRRPLVPLSDEDAEMLSRQLGPVAGPPAASLEGYQAEARRNVVGR